MANVIEMLQRCAQHNVGEEPGVNLALTVEQSRRVMLEDVALMEQFPLQPCVIPSDIGIEGAIPITDG